MNLEEFLTQLKGELTALAPTDRAQLEEYFRELFLDQQEQGLSEEEIISGFGAPKEVSKKILDDYGQNKLFEDTLPISSSREDEYSCNTPISSINIQAQNIPIQIVPVENGPVRVLFGPKKKRDQILFSTDNGSFIFNHSVKIFPLSISLFPPFYQSITVEIPTNFTGELFVRTRNAKVIANGLTHLTLAHFQSSNSKIMLENICCSTLTAKSSNGKIILNRIAGNTLDAATSNARIIAQSCATTENIILNTNNGAIQLDAVQSRYIDLHTSNASVTGSIIGDYRDYAITSHTSNAANNLGSLHHPEQTKTLHVKTSNGRIHIDFLN